MAKFHRTNAMAHYLGTVHVHLLLLHAFDEPFLLLYYRMVIQGITTCSSA